MEKSCSRCQATFECCNTQPGCWCEELEILPETLEALKLQFDNCLCPDCLSSFAAARVNPLNPLL